MGTGILCFGSDGNKDGNKAMCDFSDPQAFYVPWPLANKRDYNADLLQSASRTPINNHYNLQFDYGQANIGAVAETVAKEDVDVVPDVGVPNTVGDFPLAQNDEDGAKTLQREFVFPFQHERVGSSNLGKDVRRLSSS